jgi:hypothetical protein
MRGVLIGIEILLGIGAVFLIIWGALQLYDEIRRRRRRRNF